jgi:hypothetical protein
MRCITKENTIDRPSLKLIQLPPFLQNKALATKDMEVTHIGCATMHQLVACVLLMHSEVDPVRHIACGIHCLSQYLLGVLCSSSIVRVTTRVFGEENLTPCTIVIVPGSVSYHVQNSLQNNIISIQRNHSTTHNIYTRNSSVYEFSTSPLG